MRKCLLRWSDIARSLRRLVYVDKLRWAVVILYLYYHLAYTKVNLMISQWIILSAYFYESGLKLRMVLAFMRKILLFEVLLFVNVVFILLRINCNWSCLLIYFIFLLLCLFELILFPFCISPFYIDFVYWFGLNDKKWSSMMPTR